jgi:hypothetical protein
MVQKCTTRSLDLADTNDTGKQSLTCHTGNVIMSASEEPLTICHLMADTCVTWLERKDGFAAAYRTIDIVYCL